MSAPRFPLDPQLSVFGYRPLDRAAAPAVSIVTAFFNPGALFRDTVDSVLRQSLQQWEWLIVNDGSTEARSLQALAMLRDADPRIIVIDTPNRGVAAARNAALAAARAPLVFFLDSDDVIAPLALELLAWTLTSHGSWSLAASWIATFGEEQLLFRHSLGARHMFPHDNTVPLASMIRREAALAVGGFDERRRGGLEDFDFFIRCAAAGHWGHDVPLPLAWIRRKPDAAYTSYRWEFQDAAAALARFRADARRRFPELFRDGPPNVEPPRPLLATHALVTPELPFENRLARPAGQRRVLMLLPWMIVGGGERFALDLATGLVAAGDRVSVALTRDDADNPWMDELAAITGDNFDLRQFLQPADYPRFLVYLIRSRQISHIWVSNSLLGYQLLPFIRAHCPDVAILDYNHAWQPERNGGLPRASLEHRSLLDMAVVASDSLRQWMIAHGGERQRIEVCTINIDTDYWRPDLAARSATRAELGIEDATPLIVFVGRLSPEKRPQLAVAILRELQSRGVAFRALIVGDGDELAAVRGAARQLAPQVTVLGAQPHARVRALLNAADLLLLPSAREGIATVIYEALALGVVPVASDVGGQRELVTPACGVLVPLGPNELRVYVDELTTLCADASLRRAMGDAGRARVVEHFSKPQLHARIASLLDAATALHRDRPLPQVDEGVALAMTSLAIERFQLESRLRRLAPVRLLLRARGLPVARLLPRLGGFGAAVARFDRTIYRTRREILWRIKRALGRPYNR